MYDLGLLPAEREPVQVQAVNTPEVCPSVCRLSVVVLQRPGVLCLQGVRLNVDAYQAANILSSWDHLTAPAAQ
jgi:hypothetical protein